MPHQQLIADVAFEIDPSTGYLAYSTVIVIGPRQATGKTELTLPVMTHRCTGFGDELSRWVRDNLGVTVQPPGPQRVLYTAQTADDARKKWREVHLERLKASGYYKPRRQFETRLTTNREAFIWGNRSIWSPGSTTGKTGGTGDTLDLGIIDEAWSRPDSRTELGMRPAMMTRPWSQLWMFSMIPGLSRAAPGSWPFLKEWRARGRACVESGVRSGIAFFDFTAAADADPDDPATWFSCMPGLGRTVRLARVAEDNASMDPVDFAAEYLGWEPKATLSKWGLVDRKTWTDRKREDSTIDGSAALGVEISEDRQRGWVGAAGRRADGHWHVEIVEPGYKIPDGTVGIDWMVRRIVDISEAQDICAVVIDPRRPAHTLILPLTNAGIRVITPTPGEVGAACGRFYDATGQGRIDRIAEAEAAGIEPPDEGETVGLFHLGQPVLETALGQARKFDLGIGAFVFVKRGVTAEVEPVYAVTLGMYGHELIMGEPGDALDGFDEGGVCGRCGRSTYRLDGAWCHAVDDTPACG